MKAFPSATETQNPQNYDRLWHLRRLLRCPQGVSPGESQEAGRWNCHVYTKLVNIVAYV